MPPPPPAFLPSGRRGQRLDPTRHLISRELWNQVRFHASASRYENDDNSNRVGGGNNKSSTSSTSWWWRNDNNIRWAISLLHAILYEMQPFRMKPLVLQFQSFIQEGGFRKITSSLMAHLKSSITMLTTIYQRIRRYLHQIDFYSIQSFVITHKILLAKSCAAMLAVRIYYRTLLYVHDLLAAGPLFVIATLFILLYTIGLGDNTGAGSGIPSAYSVFNRGVRRILGTVDGEELARQYAGGFAAARAAAAGGGGGREMNNRNDGIWMMHENERNRIIGGEEEEEARNLVNERRRQRRLERLQQRRIDGDGNENDDDGGGAGNAIPRQHNLNEIDRVDDEDVNNAAATIAGRKSGKKARRKNLELRREIQRQRQAAAALGFGDGGVEDWGAVEEMDADVVGGFDDWE